jgi:LysM repeat protein
VKRSAKQTTIDGRNFYLHEVLNGQTLYGICKEYKATEEDIRKFNPDLNKRSVYPGMVLRIPIAGNLPTDSTVKPDAQFILHTVLSKETLFSLSRQYGIKVDDIRELNPEARGNLKTGTVIKIPKDKITLTQQPAIISTVPAKPAEEADSDTGKVKDQPCRTKPSPHGNENFRLAVLLPLNISQNDTLVYSDTLKTEHFRFYEFLEGLYLAIDSMNQQGLNMTVEVFDTERDPETLRRLIDSGGIRDANLIIGPVFPNEIEVVTDYSRSKHIPMVSPFSTFDVLKENPYAFQVRNKIPKQIELASEYLGTRYNQNMIVIGRYAERKSPEFERFLTNLAAQVREHDPAKKATIRTVFFSEVSRTFINQDSVLTNIDQYFSATVPNYIILPSENEVFITEVINLVHQESLSRNISVFGLNQWVFTDIDLGSLYDVGFEHYSDFGDDNPFVDYTDPSVLDFCRKYKENWNIEPSKYSFQGFDITYFFTRALFQFGPNLVSSVPCWAEYLNYPTMLVPLRFKSAGNSNGFENHAVTVVKYRKDELLRKRVN